MSRLKAKFGDSMPPLPRLGLLRKYRGNLNSSPGMAGDPDYWDRKAVLWGCIPGRYQTVLPLHPQENGNKTDVRWCLDGRYRVGLLVAGRSSLRLPPITTPLRTLNRLGIPMANPAENITVTDYRQSGLGSGSCGGYSAAVSGRFAADNLQAASASLDKDTPCQWNCGDRYCRLVDGKGAGGTMPAPELLGKH